MRFEADGVFKWICHCVDHYSKFNILIPLEDKEAPTTVYAIVERFFSVFGLPKILQSHNGSKFVNRIIKAIVVMWPGNTSIVNGSAGHCQSHGLVEQGNNTIRAMIGKRRIDTKTNNWSRWLPEIQCIQILL